jgi:L-alanine-DL-glutamate epimerase-like enolase superfamily enzyme
MAEQGVDSGKLKVGLDIGADIRRLGIMREALSIASDHPQLMIDVNEYWSPKQAVRYIRRIEDQFDLACVEEPARRWDYQGLRRVSRQISAAVATGENLNSVADFYPLIAHQAVDIINTSQIHSGVTGCRQVAHLARLYDLPVSMMNSQANFMGHVAASLPNHTTLEVLDCGREQCLEFDNRIEDGYLLLGHEPGFGVKVNAAKLAALQAQPPTGIGRFPFPRREGAGRYLVPPAQNEVPWRGN